MAIPKRLPETLTPLECTALLAQPKPRYPTGLRDLCMLRLMLNTGLRASECLNLKVRDVDWLSGKLMVREGKGKKDRTLWVNEDVLTLLRKWRERRPVESELLFTTLEGKSVNDRALRAMVERRAKKARIPKSSPSAHVEAYVCEQILSPNQRYTLDPENVRSRGFIHVDTTHAHE